MFGHIQIINVPVNDQDLAHDFYVGVLGLEVHADLSMGPHGRWLQVAPPGAATSLALTPATADSPAGSIGGLVFETNDIDAHVLRLTDAGVRFEGDIEEMPWARVARFEDPDGNQLALQTELRR